MKDYLVIDRDESVAISIADLLISHGYNTDYVAAEQFAPPQKKYQTIIVEMPAMDNPALKRFIQHARKKFGAAIVATASAKDYLRFAGEFRFDSVIIKPFPVAELLRNTQLAQYAQKAA